MSYYQQQYQYDPQYVETIQQIVLEKLSIGLIIGAITAWAVVALNASPIFAGIAFLVEIVAIIGYFFARSESTIETLYYMFVGSTSVLLGFTFQAILGSTSNGMDIIAVAFGITAMVVGGTYYYTSTRLPDTTRLQRIILPISLLFIFFFIMSIFINIGSIGFFLLSIFGAVLFSLYLYMDFARLMRGDIGRSPARLAWSLYWDILLVFRYVLQIVYMLMARD
ncbi:MAG: Bax inhibitor-1 family protein [Candidatus Kariarchaeaceae archaeon]|jgi:FtsH-binding integral membrane protein